MYALFAICNTLSPSRLDDQILSNAKERYADQIAKMSLPFTTGPSAVAAEPTTPATATAPTTPAATTESEAIAAYKELFLFACPKFITANPPPFHDHDALNAFMNEPPEEPAARHLDLFLSGVRVRAEVPTLRSYLKLYTSLDASKLSGFLERDEEELVQLMMVMKGASRGISRVNNEGTLLDGQVITTTDLDFVINEVRVFHRSERVSDVNEDAEHGPRGRIGHQPQVWWMVCAEYGALAEGIRRATCELSTHFKSSSCECG
jgi:translation initiation factor 3 subunit L